ncbi:polysaccharide pyruvyl transferase family protein [Salegentibacter sp. HM20]
MTKEKTELFWYSIHKFRKRPRFLSRHNIRRILGKEKENYGDLLSKYLVEKILGRKTNWYKPQSSKKKTNYLAIGSILNYADKKSCIWGSGILDRKHLVSCDKIFAVRGPLSRKRLLDLGIDCPAVYGDPALLLPEYYNPKIRKRYQLGITPHIVDYRRAKNLIIDNPNINIIDLSTYNIEKTTKAILECDAIISSSLHGLIVAHAYNIPAVWVKFSNDLYGDDIKFYDYLASVNLKYYTPERVLNPLNLVSLKNILNNVNNIPDVLQVNMLKEGLIESCPFK